MNRAPRSSPPRRSSSPAGFLTAVGGLLGMLLKLAAGLLAFVLLLGALLVGAALALGLVAWALLRGRRPQVQVFSSSFQRMRRGRAGAGDAAPGAARSPDGAARPPHGAVIDVEVREVPDDGRPTATLQPDR